MIFIEFVSKSPDRKYYFVGQNLQSVLDDTQGGKGFGGAEFISRREISTEEVWKLRLGLLEQGIKAILEGRGLSYILRSPEGERRHFESLMKTGGKSEH